MYLKVQCFGITSMQSFQSQYISQTNLLLTLKQKINKVIHVNSSGLLITHSYLDNINKHSNQTFILQGNQTHFKSHDRTVPSLGFF